MKGLPQELAHMADLGKSANSAIAPETQDDQQM
jgi:hypothetical protein